VNDVHWLTITEASSLICERKLSPVEYVEALFARVDRLDGVLNSFIRPMQESALTEARRAQDEIAAGIYRGPMHGVPYGLKDIIDYAGVPTTAHSRVLLDNVPTEDATITRRLKEAGAIVMGKMATHEFAIGGPCFDLPWPPARNPWNPARFTGGSSTGSGAAVAAGLMPAALGSDTGGSVRSPASYCGLVGMKPTYGRVSRAGVVPLAFSLDTIGPLTRTVEDNALLLNLLAGADPRDPTSSRINVPDFTRDLHLGVRGLRIGVVRHFYTEDMKADPEVEAGMEDAIGVFHRLGAQVSEARLHPLEIYASCNRNILLAEAYSIHERWLQDRPGDYGALTRRRLLAGAFVRAVEYLQSTRIRGQLIRDFEVTMRDYDVLVTVSSMDPPLAIEDPEAMEYSYARQARNAFNVIASPAISIPVGFTEDGLPLSMQIIGRAFDEGTVYRVAQAYEDETPWNERRPPLD